MIKIAIVINELNVMGGTHKQLLRLAEYLQQNQIDFTIFTKEYILKKTYSEFSNFNIVSLRYDKNKKNNRGIISKFLSENAENRKLSNLITPEYNVVNVHDNGLVKLISDQMKQGKVIVWQINDLPGEFRVGNAKNIEVKHKLLNKIAKAAIIKTAHNIDAVTVNVTKNMQRVKEYLKTDAKVFYCGVDENSELQKHSGISREKIKLLSTGVLLPYRNYESLILVVNKLCQSGYDVTLDIIGSTHLDMQYTEKIQRQIDELGMQQYVTIRGQVDNATYNELYNECDIFLFMNIDQSWGLAVFEAMSAGIPTLVSNSVGAIELLHNEQDAIILDPLDIDGICEKIVQLYEDKDYYNRISTNAANAVKEFTWDKLYSSNMLDLFFKLYNERNEK